MTDHASRPGRPSVPGPRVDTDTAEQRAYWTAREAADSRAGDQHWTDISRRQAAGEELTAAQAEDAAVLDGYDAMFAYLTDEDTADETDVDDAGY